MSKQRRAQLGLVSAASILLLTVGVLFIGAKSSLEDRQKAAVNGALPARTADVSLATMHPQK